MIIRWEWDEQFDEVSADERLLIAATEVLRAHRFGKHLVVLERKLASRLAELNLSDADRALAVRLGAEFTQTGSLHRSARKFIKVENSLDGGISVLGNAVCVAVGALIKTGVLEAPVLLVENLHTDGWLLHLVLQLTAQQAGRGMISLDPHHGGGDDIATVFDALLKRKRMVVSLVDSDKSAPTGAPNGKLARLQTVLDRSKWPLGLAESPPCREAENIIPLDVIMEIPSGIACPSNPLLLQISEREASSSALPENLYFSYLDIKLGTTEETRSKLAASDREWVENKLNLGGLSLQCEISGYGSRVVQQIMADGRHITQLRQSLRSRSWRAIFFAFFEDICWFFISSRRLVT